MLLDKSEGVARCNATTQKTRKNATIRTHSGLILADSKTTGNVLNVVKLGPLATDILGGL